MTANCPVAKWVPGNRNTGGVTGIDELRLVAKELLEHCVVPEPAFETSVDENFGEDAVVDGVIDGFEEGAKQLWRDGAEVASGIDLDLNHWWHGFARRDLSGNGEVKQAEKKREVFTVGGEGHGCSCNGL